MTAAALDPSTAMPGATAVQVDADGADVAFAQQRFPSAIAKL